MALGGIVDTLHASYCQSQLDCIVLWILCMYVVGGLLLTEAVRTILLVPLALIATNNQAESGVAVVLAHRASNSFGACRPAGVARS